MSNCTPTHLINPGKTVNQDISGHQVLQGDRFKITNYQIVELNPKVACLALSAPDTIVIFRKTFNKTDFRFKCTVDIENGYFPGFPGQDITALLLPLTLQIRLAVFNA